MCVDYHRQYMIQLDNPPAVPLSRSSDPADPRFGATALDEELRFHFEFLGSIGKTQRMMLQLLGGKVWLGF